MYLEQPHGHFTVLIEDGIIYTQLEGDFNEQGVIAWADELKAAIKTFNGEPFLMLVDEMLAPSATPGALKEGNNYNQWLNEQNMLAKAVVYSSSMLRDIDIKHLPARTKQNIAYFDNLASAKKWLNAQSMAMKNM